MSIEDYDKTYPNVQKRCQAHKENIKAGLHKIDLSTGLTKYQISRIKSKEILTAIDETGISGYKKKGQKTRATHMNKIDSLGRNGYSQIASKAIIKGNQTKASKGLITTDKDRDEFYRYKLVVLYLTAQNKVEITEGYITGLAGKENAWQVDHRFSILKGYQQKVSPLIIGHKKNLKMLPWRENISKHSKCSIDINELLSETNYTNQKSLQEYNKVIELINEDIIHNIPPNAAYLLERLYETTLRN
jgi:hypothetical protein